MDSPLEVDGNSHVIIPKDPRRRAELAIEAAANAVAIADGCGRSIMSPVPCVAFIPGSPEARTWPSSTKGIPTDANFEVAMHTSLSPETMSLLADRLDGVALLAETLSHTHGVGKFREALRVFERAFARSSTSLVDPLSIFLEGACLGYTPTEIEQWTVTLRHPATHADRRPDFVLESHVRPVLARIQQAAYDVVFNKALWRSPDASRREVWIPDQWLTADGELRIFEKTAPTLHIEILDPFGSFPLDISRCFRELPDEWWAHVPESHSLAVPHIVTRIPLRQAKTSHSRLKTD